MSWDCSKRAQILEWHDTPEASDEDLAVSFDFLKKTCRRIGLQREILKFVFSGINNCPHGRTVSVLDLNCGRGDLAGAIADWTRRRKKDVQLLGVDRFGRIVQMARESHGHKKEIVFDVRDFTDSSFRHAQQFDFVISAFGLHHLSDSQLVPYFRTVNLLAKCGFIIGDFLRDSRALFLMSILSRFWDEEIIRHDAPLSVRRGLTLREVRKYLNEARIENVQVKENFGIYFTVLAERRLLLKPKLSPVTGLLGT